MVSDQGVFCYDNEVNFGPHLRVEAGCHGNQPAITMLELSVRIPGLQGGEWGWRSKQLSMTSDLVDYTYVMETLQNPKGQSADSFQVTEYVEIWGELWSQGGLVSSTPFPHTLP